MKDSSSKNSPPALEKSSSAVSPPLACPREQHQQQQKGGDSNPSANKAAPLSSTGVESPKSSSRETDVTSSCTATTNGTNKTNSNKCSGPNEEQEQEVVEEEDNNKTSTTTTSNTYLCPLGHPMTEEIHTHRHQGLNCDICHRTLQFNDKVLVCEVCYGYTACYAKCRNKSGDSNNPFITSIIHYNHGTEFFHQGEFELALAEFQNCLSIRKTLAEQKWIPNWPVAIAAEMLAREQYLVGNAGVAIETCKKAISYWKASGGNPCQQNLLESQQLLEAMMHLQKHDNDKTTSNSALDLGQQQQQQKQLGVSVYHLETTFLAQVRIATDISFGGGGKDSNIHQIENLQGPTPGIIRRRSATTVSPVDGRVGAAYVHTLSGKDHVGEATHMLSYCWSYKIGDIVDSLLDYCTTHTLDPKRTYIWMDCLCINQHRVVEQKEKGGTGMLNFEQEFPKTLQQIGHMLAMMAPWEAPLYLTRLWCVFEVYAAHSNGCEVDIIMPPREKDSLVRDVISKKGGINRLYKTLANTNIENAQASVPRDKQIILGVIESTLGYQRLNSLVNDLLRSWMKQVLIQLVAETTTREKGAKDDSSYAILYLRVGNILRGNGEYDAALEQYYKCLAIQELTLGKDHPDTATTCNNIGSVLDSMGDNTGALEYYQKCLAINESAIGKDDDDDAGTTKSCLKDIGSLH